MGYAQKQMIMTIQVIALVPCCTGTRLNGPCYPFPPFGDLTWETEVCKSRKHESWSKFTPFISTESLGRGLSASFVSTSVISPQEVFVRGRQAPPVTENTAALVSFKAQRKITQVCRPRFSRSQTLYSMANRDDYKRQDQMSQKMSWNWVRLLLGFTFVQVDNERTKERENKEAVFIFSYIYVCKWTTSKQRESQKISRVGRYHMFAFS